MSHALEVIARVTAARKARAAETFNKSSALIDRWVEAQQPENRFRAAIIETGKIREKLLSQGIKYAPQSVFDAPLAREQAIASPKVTERVTAGMPAALAPLAMGLTLPAMGATAGQVVKEDKGMIQIPTILGGTAVGAALTGIAALALARTKFPWETPKGEGMLAPWRNMEEVAPGIYAPDEQAMMYDPRTGGYRVAGSRKRRRKRYSFSTNSRIGTLLKADNAMNKQMDKVADALKRRGYSVSLRTRKRRK